MFSFRKIKLNSKKNKVDSKNKKKNLTKNNVGGEFATPR